MKKVYYILLIIWAVAFTYMVYKYFQNIGYWKNPLLLSMLFYGLAILVNKRLNKLLIIIAGLYLLMGMYFIFDLVMSLPGY